MGAFVGPRGGIRLQICTDCLREDYRTMVAHDYTLVDIERYYHVDSERRQKHDTVSSQET